MTAIALMQDLARRGVVLTAEAGRLRYRAPAGAVTPDLRRQLERNKAALLLALAGNAQQTGLFDGAAPSPDAARLVAHRGHDLPQAPHAARLVHGDFERARQRLAELEAEIDAAAAMLAHAPRDQWPADVIERANALAREALTLAPVADYASLAELETAAGAAYQAVVKCPSDQSLVRAYARLDDAWAAVLGLPDLPHEVKNGL